MTRVARWFGFANQNTVTDEQLVARTNKQPYYYQKPQQQQLHGNGDKEHCYLCNKHPWVPMMANNIQYPPTENQWDTSKQTQLQNHIQHYPSKSNIENDAYNGLNGQQQQQNIYGATNNQQASSNIRQRAIKFNFPFPFVPPNANKAQDATNHIQYSTGPFLPIPIPPILSNSVLPPLYNAQNFLPPVTPLPNTLQELPSTKPAHFAENIAQHSELHADTAFPTQVTTTSSSSNRDSSFEIVKSHQLVDYVSSIEYPASYVPSHSYDISTQTPFLPIDNQQANSQINTGLYQHSTFSPHLSQHVPASQILTEIGSFKVSNEQPSVHNPDLDVYKHTTDYNNHPQFLETVQHYVDDNYAAASQQNSSVFEQQKPQQHHINLDALTLESNDFIHTTITPETLSTREETTMLTTELESTTAQPQTHDNEIEFIASIQTNAQFTNIETNKPKQRETPKRLLDSPIQHIKGNLGVPRPFTRDPSDLTFRLSSVNHKLPEKNQVSFSHPAWKLQTVVTESPRSTSTFSSIDASGQYAGMSPPSLPSTYNSGQSLLPYLTTKNRPRPFESTRVNMIKKPSSTASHASWSQKLNLELHTPQESMLVKSQIKPVAAVTTTTSKPKTTKYLTKILATNLRELLQREHEPTKLKLSPNSLDIDINKLQKNIDDWTEQEYTSLSHKPSTPTIRGRSKNIPFEYLPTTTATVKPTRQSKTTKGFTDSAELPSSINQLEPLYERESTKHYQYTQITDNHLRDFHNNFKSMKSKSFTSYKTTPTAGTTTTTTTTAATSTSTRRTSTSEKTLHLRPIQIQEPEELWKKAKVSISPKTQEKVYVITPQPIFFPQRFYSPTLATTTTTTEKSLSNLSLGSGFKSPRFLVRPTPGNAHNLIKISDTQSKENSKENINNSNLVREWFGLRGLSAYVPSEPVEIIDGNSKVLNIVTAPSNLETTTRHNIMDLTKNRQTASKRKATIPPSPR